MKFKVSSLLEPMEGLSLWDKFDNTVTAGAKNRKLRILKSTDLTANDQDVLNFVQDNQITDVSVSMAKTISNTSIHDVDQQVEVQTFSEEYLLPW